MMSYRKVVFIQTLVLGWLIIISSQSLGNDQNIIRQLKVEKIFVNHVCPFVFSNKDENVFYKNGIKWELLEDFSQDSSTFSVQKTINGEITKRFQLPEINEQIKNGKDLKYYPFNPPEPCTFEASEDGKYFLIKLFAGQSFLYNAETDQIVSFLDNNKNKSGYETLIGFSKNGGIYCGVQSINPMLSLRDIESGKIQKQFEHPKFNFPPGQHDLSKIVSDPDENGFVYNYLSGPVESNDGRYVVFSFTLHQFRCLFAIVFVADTLTQRIVSKNIVDTSVWYSPRNKFIFDTNRDRMLFLDGRTNIRLHDFNKGHVTSVFTMPTNKSKNGNETLIKEIESFFFAAKDNVVIRMRIPSSVYQYSGTFASPTRPLTLSYLWNTENGKITEAPWQTKDAYTLRYWISPDQKTVATYHVKYDLNDFTIIDRKRHLEGISFWDTAGGDLLRSITGHFESIFISPDWKMMEVLTFDQFPANNGNTTEGTKTFYNLEKLTKRSIEKTKSEILLPLQNFTDSPVQFELREWNSMVGTKTNAKYISSTETAVKLEKEDGKIITVPLVKLSQEDQEYIKQLVEEMKKNK